MSFWKFFKLFQMLIFYWKELLKKIKVKRKNKKEAFLDMLIGTLDGSLLENMLTAKGMLRASYENKEGERVSRDDHGNKIDF